MPRLVHALCMVQNTLLGHYYTALHDFCQQHGYLIPTPEWTQVQTEFDDAFGAAKRDTERLSTLQRGKAVKTEFYSRPDTLQTRTMSHRTNSAGSSGMIAPTRSNGRLPPPVPAPGAGGVTPPMIDLSTRPGGSSRAPSTTAGTSYGRPSPPMSTASFHTAGGRSDLFPTQPTSAGASAAASRRSASQPTSPYLGSGSVSSLGGSSAALSAAGKKKPPPPPPPKRRPEPRAPQDWVVAQYDFAGEGEGDLSFREGDRIRVVVRTASTNDWWEGECGGARGSFPANYCKAA
jgi:amphiphysin